MDAADCVVAIVRAWGNGAVDLEIRGVGGENDGQAREVRLERGEGNGLLIAMARAMTEATA
jgi:hypothetical protein